MFILVPCYVPLSDGFGGFIALLAFNDDGLEFFQNRVAFVGLVDAGVAPLGHDEEVPFHHAVQFALDVAGVLLDELGEAAGVNFEIGVFREDDDDFAAYTR